MNLKRYDYLVVGAGPASYFFAYEYLQKNPQSRIAIVDMGDSLTKRVCPMTINGGTCLNCNTCAITHGSGGAGSFSDGKADIGICLETGEIIGTDLHKYIGESYTKKLIHYTDQIYVDFGAPKQLKGQGNEERIKNYVDAAKKVGLNLSHFLIRHLGTDGAQEMFKKLEKYLDNKGVDFYFHCEVNNLIMQKNTCSGVIYKEVGTSLLQKLYANNVVLAVGRAGAYWLNQLCKEHHIDTLPGKIDFGIRYELLNIYMSEINDLFYEAKISHISHKEQINSRFFCQNPSGLVSQECIGDIILVNGHAYLDSQQKTDNTNLALLVSYNLPYTDDLFEYLLPIIRSGNRLAKNNIMVQRLQDLLRNRSTTPEVLKINSVHPTLKAVPGNLGQWMPHDTLKEIITFIKTVNKLIPGFANGDNLLYAPEAKLNKLFKLKFDSKLQLFSYGKPIYGLKAIGDGSGLTNGLLPASVSGVALARLIDV